MRSASPRACRVSITSSIDFLPKFGIAFSSDSVFETRSPTVWIPARQPNAMDDILIEELELGVRSYNCLKRAGIQTVGDLVSKTEAELNAIPNFGKKSIDEVVETLNARGLSLRQD